MEIIHFIVYIKFNNFLSYVDSDSHNFYYLFVCHTKKLFDCPVERDLPNEKAFKAAQYPWSENRGYIDAFYATFLTKGIRVLAELIYFVDRQIIDGITNGVGILSFFFIGEGIKYVGGGHVSSYLFLYLSYVLIFEFSSFLSRSK